MTVLVLKLFPGDPILDNPDFRDPLLKNATEVSLVGGAYFLNVDRNILRSAS